MALNGRGSESVRFKKVNVDRFFINGEEVDILEIYEGASEPTGDERFWIDTDQEPWFDLLIYEGTTEPSAPVLFWIDTT